MLKKKIINLVENFIKKNYFLKYFVFSLYFFFKKKQISKQFESKLPYINNLPKKKNILIPVVETNHQGGFHLVVIAKALVLRGYNVKILICDGFLPGCEIKSFKNRDDKNPCFICKYNIKNILPIFKLDYIKFDEYINRNDLKKINQISKSYLNGKKKNLIYKQFNFTQAVKDSLIRYYYGNTLFHGHKNIKLNHSKTALTSFIVAKKIYSQWKPDIILNNMFVYSAWEPFSQFYKNKCRKISVNLSPLQDGSIYFNMFELLNSNLRFKNYLKARKNKNLNQKEIKTLNSYLKIRKKGNTNDMKKNNIILNHNIHYKNLVEQLKQLKKQKKKNIFLFTNVYWDIGLSEQAGIYKDVISWTLDTIKILSKSNKHHIFIKTHPAEISKEAPSITSLEDIIKEKLKKIPDNVSFIRPSSKINVYSLSSLIDLGVIYTGSLGIEMILLGVPIITTGYVPYESFNFSINPKNREEYKNELFKEKNIKPKYKKNLLELYSYFFFIKGAIPWDFNNNMLERFNGYNFNRLDDLYPNKNKMLDHLCDCITDVNFIPENW